MSEVILAVQVIVGSTTSAASIIVILEKTRPLFGKVWKNIHRHPQLEEDSLQFVKTLKEEDMTPYRISQATEIDIEWIAEQEACCFSSEDAVPLETLKDWYNSNPTGFFILEKNDEIIGHIDFLPIKPATMKRLSAGTLTEKSSVVTTFLETTKRTTFGICM